jgi:tankyrase
MVCEMTAQAIDEFMKKKLPYGELSDICCEQNPDPKRQRQAIEALLKTGADIQEADKNGVTPLHFAVRFRNVAAVEALLRHGANVNQACKRSGSTPLHRAVTWTGAPSTAGKQEEAKEIIRLLLQYGADPALKNKSGKRPADYVKDEQILNLLGRRL